MVCEARLLFNLYWRWLFENKVGNEGSRNFVSSAHQSVPHTGQVRYKEGGSLCVLWAKATSASLMVGS